MSTTNFPAASMPHGWLKGPVGFVAVGFCLWLFAACSPTPQRPTGQQSSTAAPIKDLLKEPLLDEQTSPPGSLAPWAASGHDPFANRRRQMVEQLRSLSVTDERVLGVMNRVPRHLFVSQKRRHAAYANTPLPIGHGQTISQPQVVALMSQLVNPRPSSRALDIGTGSGYQAAILAQLCKAVYSIEIVEPLARQAKSRLAELGYDNVQVRHGDGYRGWPDHAPFDVIVVAAAPDHIPPALVEQLAPEGRMVIPVGNYRQELMLITKDAAGNVQKRKVVPVAFVPMTGMAAGDPGPRGQAEK